MHDARTNPGESFNIRVKYVLSESCVKQSSIVHLIQRFIDVRRTVIGYPIRLTVSLR